MQSKILIVAFNVNAGYVLTVESTVSNGGDAGGDRNRSEPIQVKSRMADCGQIFGQINGL